MKKFLATLAISIFIVGCSTVSNIKKRIIPPKEDKKTEVKTKDFDIKVELDPNVDPGEHDPEAVMIIKNKKTGKTWTFTHKEFKLVIRSWKNWRIVSKVDPTITKIEQDKKYLYITFNYYIVTNNGRTKTSILSGVVIIKKDYVQDKTKENFWKTTSIIEGIIIVILAALHAI